jgi:long-chain acyl-CoA synthetase
VVPAYARGESRRAVEDRLREHFEKIGASLSPHKRVRILRFTDNELPRTRTRKVKRDEVAAALQRMIHDQPSATIPEGAELAPWLVHALEQVADGAAVITPATRLIEDLGLDSLALAELAEEIAVKAGTELSAEQLANLSTIADLQGLLTAGQNRPRLPSYSRFARPYTVTLPGPLKRLGEEVFRRSLDSALEGWLKPRIMGRGNIPANRNLLVVANHSSHIDFALVGHAMGPYARELVVLAAKDYFFNTGLRRFLTMNFTRLIPFDRERAQLESLEDALAQLRAGRSVLMFPEGTRSPDGAIHEFKSGAGYLALHGGCDVLPMHIRGSYDVLGKGSLIPRYASVEVRIGAAITSDTLRAAAQDTDGPGAYRRLADLMHAAVLSLSNLTSKTSRASLPLVSPVALPVPRKATRAERRRLRVKG